jgi:hypothetical protein
VGFVVDKVVLGQVFSECFGYTFQSFYRLLHTQHHPSSGTDIVIAFKRFQQAVAY